MKKGVFSHAASVCLTAFAVASAVLGCRAPSVGNADRPRIAVFHNHLVDMARQRNVPLAEAVRVARSWGVEGIDVFDAFDGGESEELLALGLKCAAFVISADFAVSDDSAKVEKAFAFVRRHGADVIMLVPGQVPDGMTREAAWAAAKPRIAAFVARAAREGVPVALEDFDWNEPIVGSAEHLRRAFREVPGLGHVLDTGNYDRWGDDPLACAREFAPRIRHVHVKDLAKDGSSGSVAAGTGRIPLDAILRQLRADSYRGWLTVECFGAGDMWRTVETSVAYLNRF